MWFLITQRTQQLQNQSRILCFPVCHHTERSTKFRLDRPRGVLRHAAAAAVVTYFQKLIWGQFWALMRMHTPRIDTGQAAHSPQASRVRLCFLKQQTGQLHILWRNNPNQIPVRPRKDHRLIQKRPKILNRFLPDWRKHPLPDLSFRPSVLIPHLHTPIPIIAQWKKFLRQSTKKILPFFVHMCYNKEKANRGGTKMPRTSNKAELIMDYVNQFIQENGYSPSVREIGAAVGLRSTASVSYHLQALQEKGLLQAPSAKGRKRALVTGARPGQIPVVGVVTAGIPILAVENQEGTMPWHEAGCFALRVRGDSMINAGILDGDKVVVRPQTTADNGQIVVARIEDEATVKRLLRKNGQIWLMPENENYAPIDGTNAEIIGIVKGVVREY